jgi:hypothetical protein
MKPFYSQVTVYLKELNELPVASIRIDSDSAEIYSKQRHPGYKKLLLEPS